jgi:hypothetical protein
VCIRLSVHKAISKGGSSEGIYMMKV